MKKTIVLLVGVLSLLVHAQSSLLETEIVESNIEDSDVVKSENADSSMVDSNEVAPTVIESNVIVPTVVESNIVASNIVEKKVVSTADLVTPKLSEKKWHLGVSFKASYIYVPKFVASADSIHRRDSLYYANLHDYALMAPKEIDVMGKITKIERNLTSEKILNRNPTQWDSLRVLAPYTIEQESMSGYHIELGVVFDYYVTDRISLVTGLDAGMSSLSGDNGLKNWNYNARVPVLVRYDLPKSFWVEAGLNLDFVVNNKFSGIDDYEYSGCPDIDNNIVQSKDSYYDDLTSDKKGCLYNGNHITSIYVTGNHVDSLSASGYELHDRVAYDQTKATSVRDYNSSIKFVPNLSFGIGKTFQTMGYNIDVGLDFSYGIKAITTGRWFTNILEVGGRVIVWII